MTDEGEEDIGQQESATHGAGDAPASADAEQAADDHGDAPASPEPEQDTAAPQDGGGDPAAVSGGALPSVADAADLAKAVPGGAPAAAAAAAGAGQSSGVDGDEGGESAELGTGGEPEAIGAGGTSLVSAGVSAVGSAGAASQGDDIGGDILKGQAAGATTAAAGQAMTLMMILNFLKMLAAQIMAAISNFWTFLLGLAQTIVHAVGGFFISVGTAVGKALSISSMAGTMTTAAAAAAALAVGASTVVSVTTMSPAVTDWALTDCRAGMAQVAAQDSGDASGENASSLANAQTAYSVLAAWGMSDANVAGILGNWEAESNIDPTAVQRSGGPAFQMTPTKERDAANTDNGIGLGQWTFGRNANLRAFGTDSQTQWWTVETQLAFMLSKAEAGNATVVRGMIETDQGNPRDAALYFHNKWERSADTEVMAKRRLDNADKWFGLLSGWAKNDALADSLLEQADTTLDDAKINQVRAAQSSCQKLAAFFDFIADGNPPGPWGGFGNGRIDESLLSPIPWDPSNRLRSDAVEALSRLNEAYKADFGAPLGITSGYRDYPGQVEAKRIYGSNAATPGTSNHGWALAIDVAEPNSNYTIGFSSETYAWLKRNAGKYGWAHPHWAEPGGVGPDEAWHWEYYGVAK